MPGDQLLLPLLLLTPLVGAVIVALLGPERGDSIRRISLATTLVTLLLSILVAYDYVEITQRQRSAPASTATTPSFTPQLLPGSASSHPNQTTWDILKVGPNGAAIQFYVGVDGINIWLVVLTCLLMCSAVLVSWNSSQASERLNEYYAWLLALQTGMVGVFVSF